MIDDFSAPHVRKNSKKKVKKRLPMSKMDKTVCLK